MWSEKKRVLVTLCVSAVIAIALYSATILCAMAGKVFPTEACFVAFVPFFLYSFNRVKEWIFLDKEQEILSAHSGAVPPTRIAAIVERQRRDMARSF